MFKKNQILALIIARKNSKRLKNKNIRLIKGKKCIEWSFLAAKKSKYIDHIFVSTDSNEIIKIAKKQKINAPFKRPKSISHSSSTVQEVINHFIDEKKINSLKSTYLILLQSTSPNRSEKNIDEAIKKFFKYRKFENDTLVSVKEVSNKYWWLKYSDGKLIKSIFDKKFISNKKKLYIPNGAIYISKLKKNINFYSSRTLFYVMDSYSSIDIDLKKDLYKARMAKKNN